MAILPLFHCFKKSSCQLMAKESSLNTDKLPLGGLPRNNVVRLNDPPDMTSAVYRGRKATNQIGLTVEKCFQKMKI